MISFRCPVGNLSTQMPKDSENSLYSQHSLQKGSAEVEKMKTQQSAKEERAQALPDTAPTIISQTMLAQSSLVFWDC